MCKLKSERKKQQSYEAQNWVRERARVLDARDNMSNRLLNLITYNLHNRHYNNADAVWPF